MTAMVVRDRHHKPAMQKDPRPQRRSGPTQRSSRTVPPTATPKAPTPGSAMTARRRPGSMGAQQPVGAVDQAVEVEHARHAQVGGDHDGGRNRIGPGPGGQPPEAPERQAQGGADERKPVEGRRSGWTSAAEGSEEGQRGAHLTPPPPPRTTGAGSRASTRPATTSSTRSAISATARFTEPSASRNCRPASL